MPQTAPDLTPLQVQTELAQRVSGWRSRIDPVLREEEHRHTFDLQQYGERIIGKLATAGGSEGRDAVSSVPVSFQDVASSSVRFEVSRAFAAMLQLINNRCVDRHRER